MSTGGQPTLESPLGPDLHSRLFPRKHRKQVCRKIIRSRSCRRHRRREVRTREIRKYTVGLAGPSGFIIRLVCPFLHTTSPLAISVNTLKRVQRVSFHQVLSSSVLGFTNGPLFSTTCRNAEMPKSNAQVVQFKPLPHSQSKELQMPFDGSLRTPVEPLTQVLPPMGIVSYGHLDTASPSRLMPILPNHRSDSYP